MTSPEQQFRVRISGTAECALQLDDSTFRHGIDAAGPSQRRGKGWSTWYVGTASQWAKVRADAVDRIFHFDDDPASWNAACKKLIASIDAAVRGTK